MSVPAASPAAIEVEDLSFAYNGAPVLENVRLRIEPGDFTALIGPNGGGKTTLLKLLLGLLKPDRGVVRVLGQSPERVARRMGYVPQDVNINRNFPVSVMDVVLMGLLRSGLGTRLFRRPAPDREAARRALELLDIWNLQDRRIGDLSGGQRQRVFIARALVSEPELLLLDEPTSGVDTAHRNSFYTLLKELNQRITILIVNHDLMVISSHVKSVACVNLGLHYHGAAEVTEPMMRMYQCPVELVAHGLPHRVLPLHPPVHSPEADGCLRGCSHDRPHIRRSPHV